MRVAKLSFAGRSRAGLLKHLFTLWGRCWWSSLWTPIEIRKELGHFCIRKLYCVQDRRQLGRGREARDTQPLAYDGESK